MPASKSPNVDINECRRIAQTSPDQFSDEQKRIVELSSHIGHITSELEYVFPPNFKLLKVISDIANIKINELSESAEADAKAVGGLAFYEIVRGSANKQLKNAGFGINQTTEIVDPWFQNPDDLYSLDRTEAMTDALNIG